MDDLNNLLATWEPATPERPAFRRNVWDRIAAREARRSVLLVWMDRLLTEITRPAVAVAAVAVAILLGSMVGEHLSMEYGTSAYLKANNPFAQVQSRL
jgi:hypothetical protein